MGGEYTIVGGSGGARIFEADYGLFYNVDSLELSYYLHSVQLIAQYRELQVENTCMDTL